MSQEINSGSFLIALHQKMSQYYALSGDYQQALESYMIFRDFSDSLLNISVQRTIEDMQVKYETDKQNEEIEILRDNETLKNEVIKQQRIIILVAIVLVMVVIGVLFQYIRLSGVRKLMNVTLTAKNNYIEKQNTDLQELNATKDKLFSIISHDLRSPLSSILGITQLLKLRFKQLKPEKIEYYIGAINKSSESIYFLVENLLNWSRIQRNKLEPDRIKFMLKELGDEIFIIVKNLAEEKDIQLSNTIPDDLFLNSDRNLVSAVLRNLVNNSIKYTNNGTITLKAKKAPDCIILEQSDTVVGMSEEQLKKLINDERIKSTEGTKGEKGTGLGFHICKEFINMLVGKINVTSEIGKGTTFKILLPLDQMAG